MEFALKISFLNWIFYLLQKFFTDIFTSVSQTTTRFFISNAWLKLAKNQVNTKQHTEAELLALIHIFHPSYLPRITEHILKNKEKNKCACIPEII